MKIMIKVLNTILATMEVIASNVKGRHWTVYGPNFRSVHLVLDDIWKTLMDGSDKVAETIRVLGGLPEYMLTAFVSNSEINQESMIYESYQMVRDTRNEINVLIAIIHGAVQEQLVDPTTENDLLNITSDLRHWMIFLDGMIEEWGEIEPITLEQ